MRITCLRSVFIMIFIVMMILPASLPGGEGSGIAVDEAHEIVERLYLEILDRYPDERGLHTYTKFLVEEGKNEAWLRQVLRNSDEGRQVQIKKSKRRYILYALTAIPLLLFGVAFYFRKSTKDFLINSLLVLMSIIAACFFLEILLRVNAVYRDKKNEQVFRNLDSSRIPKKNAAVFLRDIIQLSANPGIVYELMPDLQVRFMGGRVTTDAEGFRKIPGSCEQSETFTIVGLGDSVMFGWGVHDQETYLAYLAQSLSNDCVRVINMAVPGYNTVMEVEALQEKGLQFQPDIVIMHFVDNDLYLPNFIRKKDKHVTLTRSYLIAALSRWQGTRVRTRPFDHLVRNPGAVPEEYQYMVGVEGYRQAMARLKMLSREYNFALLLLSNWTAPDYVTDITNELEIPVIELGKPLLQYVHDNRLTESKAPVLTISKNDPHYSPLAHRIVADEVYKYLLKEGFIDAKGNVFSGSKL